MSRDLNYWLYIHIVVMDYFQQHKQTLVFQYSKHPCTINNTPLDHQLRAKIATFDFDDMEHKFFVIETDHFYKEGWVRFLEKVEIVRNKRKERVNIICNTLRMHPAICYQIKNRESHLYNKVEGLWVIIRGDIWRSLNPSIFINNTDVDANDAVLLQFEEIFTDHYSSCNQYCKHVFKNIDILIELRQFVQKRYLSVDDIQIWLQYIQDGIFEYNLKTIAVLTSKHNNWFPKKYIYYLDLEHLGHIDGVMEFQDGVLHSVPLKARDSMHAIGRTIILTNEDCEKYCLLVGPKDSQPYAFNELRGKTHTIGEFSALISHIEFTYDDYEEYLVTNEIETLCI